MTNPAPRVLLRTVGKPAIDTRRIGIEAQPLVIVDDFAADPDALRRAAAAAAFVPAGHYYPGIRAALPDGYLAAQLGVVATALGRHFGRFRRIRVVDAGFAIVTTPADALDRRQRLPHVDAYGGERIALVHYLSPTSSDGTAFFRHRATGYESIDEGRAAAYFAQLEDELRDPALAPTGYIAADSPLFERTAIAEARYNRALLYRSHLLHSGAIAPDAPLSADPLQGRLTITAFFALD